MKTNWTVGQKLGLSFGALIAMLLGLGLASLNAVNKLEAALDLTGSRSARKIQLAGQIDTAESDMAAAERGMIMFAAGKDVAKLEMAERKFQDDAAVLKTAVVELRSLAILPENRELLSAIDSRADDWKSNLAQVFTLLRAGSVEEAVKLSASKDTPHYETIAGEIEQVTKNQNKLIAQDLSNAASLGVASHWLVVGFILAGFGLGAAVILVIRQVSTTLRRVAGQLSEGASQVAGAAEQVSAAGQSLAQGASEQAASLEETSASSEEISAMTQRNAEHSEEAARLMGGAAEIVDGANRKMEEMVRSMKEITASSGKISKIIKVIDEIAFQTNILALNAAVEAARAGEAGLGFAVVADEVRNLAQRCAQAARDTAELIEESINRSNDGGSRISDVSTSIGAITENSTKVKLLVDEIHTGSREQSRGIEQVAGAISQMQQVTQSSAASAEESAAAGQELASLAESLQQVVGELNNLVGKTGRMKAGLDSAARRPRAASAKLRARSAAATPQPHAPSARQLTEAHRSEFPLDEVFK